LKPTHAAAIRQTHFLLTLFTNQKIKYSAESSIASVAAATPALSTLLAAVKAANLTEKLSDPKLKTTLFAPTDDAFAAYLSANNLTAAQLLASPDLKWILKNHFVKKAAIKVRRAEWKGMVEKEGKRQRFFVSGFGGAATPSSLARAWPFFPLPRSLSHAATGGAAARAPHERRRGVQRFFLSVFFFLTAIPTPPLKIKQSTELTNGAVVKSWLPGANLTIDLSKPGVVAVKSDSGSVAKVTTADVPAGAAIVHLVDAVLVPTPEAIKEAPARSAAWKAKKAASPSAAPRRLAERF
jgi:uncharacterized surface protein with fasciclin (FAS1) repeats